MIMVRTRKNSFEIRCKWEIIAGAVMVRHFVGPTFQEDNPALHPTGASHCVVCRLQKRINR